MESANNILWHKRKQGRTRSALSCFCFIFVASSLPEHRREVITPKMIITLCRSVACCTKCQGILFLIANHFGSPRSSWHGRSGGRSIVSGMHRLIGQGGRPRVGGGVFGRLTALPPPTPPQLSCLIRIRGIHKSCLHMRGRGSKSGHRDGRSGRSHWLYTANQSLKRGLEGWVQNP